MKGKTTIERRPKLIRITTVPLAFKYLLPGQCKFLSQNGFKVIMVSADGPDREDVMVQEGCPHIIVEMTRTISPWADMKAIWKMYRLFKKERPDIVHSHTPKAGLTAMIAGWLAGVPIRIHTIAGLRYLTVKGFKRKVLILMEKLTAACANHVFPNSESLHKYLAEKKRVHADKMEIIGHGSSNGINLSRYSKQALEPDVMADVKHRLHYNPEHFYLLAVGRIVKDKGITELVNAFKELHLTFDQARLVLVGSFEDDLDPIEDSTKTFIDESPFIVHVPWSNKVEYYMSLSHVLVHPSHREGFPNVLLQAGAMECPVVCSNINGNIDIVENNETGLHFQVKNEIDLFEKLEYCLKNHVEVKNMAVNLKQEIFKYFDIQYVQAQLLDKYKELLKNKEQGN